MYRYGVPEDVGGALLGDACLPPAEGRLVEGDHQLLHAHRAQAQAQAQAQVGRKAERGLVATAGQLGWPHDGTGLGLGGIR
jgi:hypothetical protein